MTTPNNRPRQLIYFDDATRRIIKITDFSPLINPADVDGVSWLMYAPGALPEDIFTDMYYYQILIDRRIKKIGAPPTDAEKERFQKFAVTIDCLETLAKYVSIARFGKITNMTGYFIIVPEYMKEIEAYNKSGTIGPLLSSLVDHDDDVPTAIAEFEIKHQTALNFFITTETHWNRWARMIRNADDPYAVLDKFRNAVGIQK